MRKRLSIIFLIIVLLITTGCSQLGTANAVTPRDKPAAPEVQPQNDPPPAQDPLPNYKDQESITVLVNKQNDLPADYVPSDLVYVEIPFTFNEKVEKRMMRKEAAEKLAELVSTAKNENIILYGVSGYRSYQTQKSLFAYFTQRDGSEEKANQISARAGQSEHQTGLAMDVSAQSVNFGLVENFGDTKEYDWLKDNAFKFGYIIRFPLGKEHITGYSYEPWHIRYVGQELAAKLYEEELTYEEYLFFRV